MTSDIIGYLGKKKPEIDRILEKYLPRQLDGRRLERIFGKPRFAYDEQALTQTLSRPIWDFLDRGGKRIRPALFLIVAEAFGGDSEKLRDFSAVVEFAHEGSIMVDDLEDKGEMRRGKPCTHRIFGEDIAINAGNFMYFIPLLTFMKSKDLDEKTIEELIDELRAQYSIAIVTHSMQQAARVSQRTAYFHLGDLIEVGDTDQVFTTPQHQLTEDYITGRFG